MRSPSPAPAHPHDVDPALPTSQTQPFWDRLLPRFVFRALRSRPGRAALTVGSIMIGVGAVVAVTVATDTSRVAQQKMYEGVTGRAALDVVAESSGYFAQDLVAKLEQVDGVAAVVPTIQQPSILLHEGKRLRMLILGIDPHREEAVRSYRLVAGEFFRNGNGVLLEDGFARALGVRVGDQVRVLTGRRLFTSATVVGLLAPEGAARFNQGGILFMHLTAAQYLFKHTAEINTASVVLKPDADPARIMAAVQSQLPEGLIARPPAARSQMARESLKDPEQGLRYAYISTLVLAGFIILNTFLMNLGERRSQFAILRAIGATRNQVVRILLLEGLLLGLLGTVLGAAAGWGGAHLLNLAMARVYASQPPELQVSPFSFLTALLLGPLLSLGGVLIPAWLAGRVSPLEGMRPQVTQDDTAVSKRLLLLGAVCFVLSTACLVASIAGWLPAALAAWAGMGLPASVIIMVPAMLGFFARFASWLLHPLLGAEGRLACRQITRRRVRTTLTIAVLLMAVAGSISFGTSISSHVDDIRDWQAQTIKGDFFIRAMFPDTATGEAAEIPESLGAEIEAIDGVLRVDTLRFVSARIGEQAVIVALREFSGQDPMPLQLVQGDRDEVRRLLFEGQVVLGSVLAQRIHAAVGDEIVLKTDKGEQKVRVAGITAEYMVGGMVVHVQRESGKRLLGVEGVDLFLIQADPRRLDEAEPQLRRLADSHDLMLHSFADLRRRVDKMIDGVVGSLWGVLALGFVVAGFGVANTLTMNVLEQTRELALLRVVAVTRRQVRKTVLAQAAIMATLGLVAGAIFGLIGSLMQSAASAYVLGHSISFAFHPTLLLGCLAGGFLIVLLAAWFPARRAARLDLLTALHYE